MTQMTSWVHQYTMRDLLDDAFDLFKERAGLLLLAGLIPYLLPTIYTAVMRLFFIKGNLLPEYTEAAFLNMIQSWTFWGYFSGFLFCATLSSSISFIAQCRIATHYALGRSITLAQSFRLLAKPFWSGVVVVIVFTVVSNVVLSVAGTVIMIVAALLIGLFSLMGTIMGIIGSIIVVALAVLLCEVAFIATLVFFFAAPVSLAVEHVGPFTAIGKAFRAAATNFKAYCVSCYFVTRTLVIFQAIIGLILLFVMFVVKFINPSLDVVIAGLLSGFATVAAWPRSPTSTLVPFTTGTSSTTGCGRTTT